MLWRSAQPRTCRTADWRAFAFVFLGVLAVGCVMIYLFIVLIDPYGVVPFSLPLDRRIVSTHQRYMFPQIVRSGHFDSLILGTSTSRLIDPERLDRAFHVRFANLAMSGATAWEQKAMLDFFLHTAGPPKVLVVGIDGAWCNPKADGERESIYGFPDWLYDDDPWNDYFYFFNSEALITAVRLVGLQLGWYRERARFDGYAVFVPPEPTYDLARAQKNIGTREPSPNPLPPPLPADERSRMSFPALVWLDASLARLPADSRKVLAFMPVHVAAQPTPGTYRAELEAECKTRIMAIGRDRGATVIDWRIASPLTTENKNYWDRLHYRVPVATRVADQLAGAVLEGRQSDDGTYVILAP